MIGASVRRHRFASGLAVVVAVGLVIRIVYVMTIGRRLTFGLDAIWYELQAGTIATGKGYVDPHTYYSTGARVATATFPPLWPALLAASKLAGFGTEQGFQVVGALVGSITVALTGFVGRRVAGSRVGLLAAAAVAVSPMLIAADGSLMAESLYVALVTGAVLAAYWAIDRPSLARFGLVGLLLGLATLARSDGIFLVPLLVGVTAWRAGGTAPAPRRVGLALVALVVVIVVLVPWSAWSSTRTDAFVPLSNNTGNLLSGANCPSTYAGRMLGTWDTRCVPSHPADTTEAERASADRSAGSSYARSHAARIPIVVGARVLRVWGLWNPSELTRLEVIESRNTGWQWFGWAFDLVVLVLAGTGTVLLIRRRAEIAPLVAVVVGVILTAATAYGSQRFALSAAPVLAVAAATTLTSWSVESRGA